MPEMTPDALKAIAFLSVLAFAALTAIVMLFRSIHAQKEYDAFTLPVIEGAGEEPGEEDAPADAPAFLLDIEDLPQEEEEDHETAELLREIQGVQAPRKGLFRRFRKRAA